MSFVRYGRLAVAAIAIAIAPEVAGAQIFTPTFLSPRAGGSVGGYLSDIGDFGAEGILRSDFGGYDLGIRAGIIDGADADVTLGAEYRNPIVLGSAPLDLAVTAGAQAVFGGSDIWGAQVGLSLGATVVPGAFSLTPYIHPRVAFVDYGAASDLEAELLGEVGVDIGFAEGLAVRFAAALDDVGADWGVGLAWSR